MALDDLPRFRIHTVTEMTGIPSPTLRAWERRYGVPTPGRTGKGYRLYSERDVEMLTRMRDLCDSGMSASDAARLVGEFFSPSPEPPTSLGDPHQALAHRIVAAVERFDPEALDRELRQSLTMGSAATIFEEVFAPALRRIGDRWHEGSLSVSQEHLASEAIGRTARTLLDIAQPASGAPTALLACWAEEQHSLPLYGIAFRLVQWSYRCVVLGARTPPEAIADAVDRLDPDVVGLSLTMAPPSDQLAEQARAYALATRGRRWIVGGAAVGAARPILIAAGAAVIDGDLDALRGWLHAPARRA